MFQISSHKVSSILSPSQAKIWTICLQEVPSQYSTMPKGNVCQLIFARNFLYIAAKSCSALRRMQRLYYFFENTQTQTQIWIFSVFLQQKRFIFQQKISIKKLKPMQNFDFLKTTQNHLEELLTTFGARSDHVHITFTISNTSISNARQYRPLLRFAVTKTCIPTSGPSIFFLPP